MIALAWIFATVWADAKRKDPGVYALFAIIFSAVETIGFWIWMIK